MTLAAKASSVVAYWPLDEVSGTRSDSVGSNDLTDNNTVGVATGKFGNAADFELDNSEYLSIADNATASMGDIDMMGRCWVKLESKAADAGIMSKWTGGANREWWMGYDQTEDRFVFSVRSSSGTVTTVSAHNFGSPSTATWYLLHAWHDATGNIIGISVNAGTADTAAHTEGINDSNADFTIGVRLQGPINLDGAVDDSLLMKGGFLDATERTEDYSSGTGVAFSDWTVVPGGVMGSVSLAIIATGDVSGLGALAGSTPLEFTSTADVAGLGFLSGSPTLVLSSGGGLTGPASVSGDTPIAFVASGSVSGPANLSASPAVTFMLSGAIGNPGVVSGSVSLPFSSTGNLTGPSLLSGSTPLTFATTADLKGVANLIASGQLTFTAAADLLGLANLSALPALAFVTGGRLTSIAPIVGSTSIDFILDGLLADSNVGVLIPGLEFTLPANRLEFELPESRLQFSTQQNRLAFSL